MARKLQFFGYGGTRKSCIQSLPKLLINNTLHLHGANEAETDDSGEHKPHLFSYIHIIY